MTKDDPEPMTTTQALTTDQPTSQGVGGVSPGEHEQDRHGSAWKRLAKKGCHHIQRATCDFRRQLEAAVLDARGEIRCCRCGLREHGVPCRASRPTSATLARPGKRDTMTPGDRLNYSREVARASPATRQGDCSIAPTEAPGCRLLVNAANERTGQAMTMTAEQFAKYAGDFQAFAADLHVPLGAASGRLGDNWADFQRIDFAAMAPSLLAVARGDVPALRRFWIERTKGGSQRQRRGRGDPLASGVRPAIGSRPGGSVSTASKRRELRVHHQGHLGHRRAAQPAAGRSGRGPAAPHRRPCRDRRAVPKASARF